MLPPLRADAGCAAVVRRGCGGGTERVLRGCRAAESGPGRAAPHAVSL